MRFSIFFLELELALALFDFFLELEFALKVFCFIFLSFRLMLRIEKAIFTEVPKHVVKGMIYSRIVLPD